MVLEELQTDNFFNGFGYGTNSDYAPTMAAYDGDDDLVDDDDDLEDDDDLDVDEVDVDETDTDEVGVDEELDTDADFDDEEVVTEDVDDLDDLDDLDEDDEEDDDDLV